jgi:iron complex outermembrane receptor protein
LNGTILTENIWKKLGVSITGRYQTKYDYVSFLVSGEVPSYWSMDAQINYKFEKAGLTAKFGATNFLNKPFYTILGGSSVNGLYYSSLTWKVKNK